MGLDRGKASGVRAGRAEARSAGRTRRSPPTRRPRPTGGRQHVGDLRLPLRRRTRTEPEAPARAAAREPGAARRPRLSRIRPPPRPPLRTPPPPRGRSGPGAPRGRHLSSRLGCDGVNDRRHDHGRELVVHRHRLGGRRARCDLGRQLAVRLRLPSSVGRRRVIGCPNPGASDRRTVLGMMTSYTSSPKNRWTSSTTWLESLVRGSNIVMTIPESRRSGLMFCWTSSTFRRSCPRPSSA